MTAECELVACPYTRSSQRGVSSVPSMVAQGGVNTSLQSKFNFSEDEFVSKRSIKLTKTSFPLTDGDETTRYEAEMSTNIEAKVFGSMDFDVFDTLTNQQECR